MRVLREQDGAVELAGAAGDVGDDRLRLGRSQRPGDEVVLHVDDDQVVLGHGDPLAVGRGSACADDDDRSHDTAR